MAAALTGQQAVVELADRIECAVLASRRGRLSYSGVERIVAAEALDLSDSDLEVYVGRAMAELGRRQQVCSPAYPFGVTELDVRLVAHDVRATLYAFLLLLSVSPEARRRRGVHKPDREFERLTAAALKRWSGGRAEVFAEMSGAAGIRQAIETLGRELGVESRPQYARPQRKDHGLDVVTWRPFRARLDGLPILLCQCTVGHSDLIAKARETVSAEWSALLDVSQQAFSTAIAVPYILGSEYEHWSELKWNTELIVDRIRILELIDHEDLLPVSLPAMESCLEVMSVAAGIDVRRGFAAA